MFGNQINLFRLYGFQVSIDFSWFLLAVLVTWSLAAGVFPAYYPGLPAATYWWMGIAGAIGLFASIIFHELSHSLVARRYGLPIRGITLFIFGGVAHMEDEPDNPRTEFLMAVAGPIASVVLAGIFFVLGGLASGTPVAVEAVLAYLAWINLLLGVFNLVPAFPLDGGRMLRAALWGWKGDIRRATRIAYRLGTGFGIVLIVLGLFQFVGGNFVAGVWWFLIGLFIRGAAQGAYQQVIVREGLRGVPVGRMMSEGLVTVPSDVTLQRLVDDYFYQHYHKLYPVMRGDDAVGCVTLRNVKGVARADWDVTTVGEVMEPVDARSAIDAGADSLHALAQMNRTGNSRLLVMRHGRLAGIVAAKDILRYLAMKLELEDEGDAARLAARQVAFSER